MPLPALELKKILKLDIALREKCLHSEPFCSAPSRIRKPEGECGPE